MLLQTHATALRPLTTAHLAQTMTLMALPLAELRQTIEAALASNPALELIEERRCPTCHRHMVGNEACPICSRPASTNENEPLVFLSSRDDFHFQPDVSSTEGIPEEQAGIETEDLPSYVLRQIAAELDEADRPLAAHLLTSLDDDGLLEVPLLEIARYHHVPLSRVEKVLRLIQHAEPVGVGSPSPQEALLVQLEVLAETQPVPPLAARAIREGMELLSRHRYAELSQMLGISMKDARALAQFVGKNLNPFPARAHWGDIHQGAAAAPDVYYLPDVIISQLSPEVSAPLVVEVITPLAGRLRLNPLFREAISQAPAEKTEQWQRDLEQAALLVKCLQQRNQAIVRLMQRLATLQRAFILHGEAHLKPLTRASLARELNVHESTISRAVAGKSVQLPNGRIIPLAKFFDRSLQVRTALKDLIEKEGGSLSDSDIARLLTRRGFPVARRTVAKYRSMEGILPAHLRQHLDRIP